jgi:hypothetical protein
VENSGNSLCSKRFDGKHVHDTPCSIYLSGWSILAPEPRVTRNPKVQRGENGKTTHTSSLSFCSNLVKDLLLLVALISREFRAWQRIRPMAGSIVRNYTWCTSERIMDPRRPSGRCRLREVDEESSTHAHETASQEI